MSHTYVVGFEVCVRLKAVVKDVGRLVEEKREARMAGVPSLLIDLDFFVKERMLEGALTGPLSCLSPCCC